ncbi:MAG: ABC transporter ATP-binding protein [Chloroflexi bacterium]|nr:ABC transporter ATP-binding protein [Chloroflexota bacterium]
MWVYLRPQLTRLMLIVLFTGLFSASGAALPMLIARGVDVIREHPTPWGILLLGGAVLLSGVVTWGVNWGRRRLIVRAVNDVILALRVDAFRAVVNQDMSFHDRFSSGRIASRIASDTKDFGDVTVLLTDISAQLIQALILAVVLLRLDRHLSLYLFAFLPIVFLAAGSLRHMARTVTREGMRAIANVNAAIKETISGIAVAKNFRQEAAIYREFAAANIQSYRVNVKRGLVLSSIFPLLNALGGVGTAMLVYVGGLSVAQGMVTAGAWYLFIASLDRFWFPVLNLSAFSAQVQAGLSAAERVFALIDAEPSVIQIDHQPVPSLRGDIRLERVWFSYNEGEPVLEDFSLHIRPGETVAIVGHTGAGKSSIVRLIARFYEFQRGRILIDGRDIRTLDLHQYRKHLGYVSQTPFLFSGTVLDNIRYARPDVTEEEVLALARRIGDGEWLETFPNGLHTQVGERGNRLSMGQRQLVALMRVLVLRPAIFILDEATASIDPFTEWQIQQAINLLLRETTSIVIAHRLFTVQAADRIIVLMRGRIIEEGTHESLLRANGHYAELYNTYFRHQSLEYVEQVRVWADEEGEA